MNISYCILENGHRHLASSYCVGFIVVFVVVIPLSPTNSYIFVGWRENFVSIFPTATGSYRTLETNWFLFKLCLLSYFFYFFKCHLHLWCIYRENFPPFCFSFTRQNLGFLCCCPTVQCRTDIYIKILAGTELSHSRTYSSSSAPQLTSLTESIWLCWCNSAFRMWGGVSMQETQQQLEDIFSWK